MLGARHGIRQSLEQLQPLGEVPDRLYIGRTLDGSLPCLLPVGNSLFSEARLCVVMSHQFRISLSGLEKSRLQHLRNLSMVLLLSAFQQRLISRFLDHGVLKDVPSLWRLAPLIEQFGFH